ncbi:MAG: hypothetical protein E7311_04620 [Clostridiales bacterium]|nr:hypothetical protein [Clostridiales bacterium]
MRTYKYKASDKYGTIFKSEMNAENTAEVMKRLKEKKIALIGIKEQTKTIKRKNIKDNKIRREALTHRAGRGEIEELTGRKSKKKKLISNPIKPLDVVAFTQNLYLLKKADFNNVHALETLLDSVENENLRIIVEDILDGVEAGEYMYSIMEYYPDVFPPIYIGIIKTGETSGTLVNSLEQARIYIESSYKIKTKLRSILLPNIAQFVFMIVLTFVGILVAIPYVEELYTSLGLEDRIPKATQIATKVIKFTVSIWYIIIPAIIAVIALIVTYIRTPEGRYKYDLFKYKLPIFGELIVAMDTQKFLNALGLNLANGMRLQDSIDLSKDVVKNTVFLSIIETSKSNLILGESWIEPFTKSNLFPKMIPEMLKIGMDTDLAEMIVKIEDYVQHEIDRKIEKTIKALPEISYAFVGVILVIFVIVVMVPIIQVYMGSFLFDAYL